MSPRQGKLAPPWRCRLAGTGLLGAHYRPRPFERVIQRTLQGPLAMRILEGDFPEGFKVLVDGRLSGEALEFRKV